MKNEEVLKRGDIQLTSAGTGIYHSEKAHGSQQVHFLQIWAKPWKSGLAPKYYTRCVSFFFFIPSHMYIFHHVHYITNLNLGSNTTDTSPMPKSKTNGLASSRPSPTRTSLQTAKAWVPHPSKPP